MSDLFQEIPSRQDEQSRIVGNFLQRLHECLSDGNLGIYSRALSQAGIGRKQLISGVGLTHDHLDLILSIVRKDHPDIMLRLLSSLDLLDLGLMGYATLSCGTLDKALSVMHRYQELTSDRYTESTSYEERYLVIRPIPRFRHMADLVSIAEDCLVGNWRAIELLLGPEAQYGGARALFAFEPPEYMETYRQVFAPCTVEFNQEVTELRIPRSWMSLPVTSGNMVMSSVTASVCERMLGPGSGARTDTPRAVRRLLLSRPGKRMLRLEEAADELLMTTAQLRKRLYRAGTSYKTIVLEVRMALAHHYLESTHLSIQEIAYLLDYAQPGPFSRAFKKFSGRSPSEVRNESLTQL